MPEHRGIRVRLPLPAGCLLGLVTEQARSLEEPRVGSGRRVSGSPVWGKCCSGVREGRACVPHPRTTPLSPSGMLPDLSRWSLQQSVRWGLQSPVWVCGSQMVSVLALPGGEAREGSWESGGMALPQSHHGHPLSLPGLLSHCAADPSAGLKSHRWGERDSRVGGNCFSQTDATQRGVRPPRKVSAFHQRMTQHKHPGGCSSVSVPTARSPDSPGAARWAPPSVP